jgi:hypothetical protein
MKLTAAVLGLSGLGCGVAAAAAQSLRVTPLALHGRVLVSFTLTGGYTDEIRAAIRSGLPTTISYDVDLRRGSTLWFDRTLGAATVSVTVKYDNLTRRYQVSRAHDGNVEWSNTTEAEDDVRRWMTEFERLPLFSTDRLEPNAEYYLRVRAQTSPRNSWFPWPWDRHAATARAKFTFIPQ